MLDKAEYIIALEKGGNITWYRTQFSPLFIVVENRGALQVVGYI